MNSKRWSAWLLALLAGGVMLWLSVTPFSWSGWEYEYCGRVNCYCEPFRDRYFVRQPFTAASNFAFILAGIWVLQSRARIGRLYRNVFGWALLLAGTFSFFSHASLTRVGEWFDLMGVYLIAGFFVIYNLKRLAAPPQAVLSWLYALILVAGGVQMAVIPALQQVVMLSLLGAAVVLEYMIWKQRRPRGEGRTLAAALMFFVIGGGVWGAGEPLCSMLGIPPHIFWHLFAGAAAAMMYQYYSSISGMEGERGIITE